MLRCDEAALRSISARLLGSSTVPLAGATCVEGGWCSSGFLAFEMAERRVDAVKEGRRWLVWRKRIYEGWMGTVNEASDGPSSLPLWP